jgi:two-component system response regulator ChvI
MVMDTQLETKSSGLRIVFVEDDLLFRDALVRNLEDSGFEVRDFDSGEAALDYFESGGRADVALLDWKLPGIAGLELLQKMGAKEKGIPVVFLTSLGDQVYEETALLNGAADFIEKSRSYSILLSRITGVLNRKDDLVKPELKTDEGQKVVCGELTLSTDSNRAFWRDTKVDLTLAEFKIVHLLATNKDKDVPHREIYDNVRGPGFVAGDGTEGYRANVRTFIKRIRQRFREVDESFNRIQTYSGFGYRWVSETEDGAHSLYLKTEPKVDTVNVVFNPK